MRRNSICNQEMKRRKKRFLLEMEIINLITKKFKSLLLQTLRKRRAMGNLVKQNKTYFMVPTNLL